MNRREFLTFKSERRLRIVELSCERLYMLLLDAKSTRQPHEHADENGSWCEEPAAVFERRTSEQLLEEIDRDLTGADVLRITDAGWLASDALSGPLDVIVDRFRATGGRVEVNG
jgi:hypothetical protein